MTACGHALHPECLIKWGDSHEECPSCSQPLRGQSHEHFLFCRVCEEQEQRITYDQMVEIVSSEKICKETLCASCLIKERDL
jgi:Zn finger protein HypA/HybF involved in hydrogenase expression